jgi:DNA-binding transcriptional regulator YiaG
MKNEIRELRKQYNMPQSQFADYFGIPKHTLQQWEQGLRQPPAYVFSMMKRILELEHKKG